MVKVTEDDIIFVEPLLEGFFYGLYSGIFAMYLQHQTTKKDRTDRMQNIILYSICSLYVLSVILFACDIASCIFHQTLPDSSVVLRMYIFKSILFGCCDLIVQFILIYRCWIVWGRNIRVVIIPSILALAFLVNWIGVSSSSYMIPDGEILSPYWGYSMNLAALVLSLTVNALVTGLIVFRIFKVFRGVKATSDDPILGATNGGSKLRSIILVFIESGMALFSIQLARLVITIVTTDAAYTAYIAILGIHEMLNGITPTIILVRTSMGLSFHDEKSMEEVVIGSLRFASHTNSVPETGSINIVGQDGGDDDIGVQRSNDITIER